MTAAEKVWRDAFGGLLESEGVKGHDEELDEQGQADQACLQQSKGVQEHKGAVKKDQELSASGVAACQDVGAALQPQVGGGSPYRQPGPAGRWHFLHVQYLVLKGELQQ